MGKFAVLAGTARLNGVGKMSPFVKRKDMKEKKPRIEKDVVLAGISVPESAEVSREKQLYKYLDCAFQNADGSYLHVTVSPPMARQGETPNHIDMKAEEFALLKKLDDLSKAKARCKVHVAYYEADKVGTDREGKKKIYTNCRANMNDLKLWRVL